jgi:predicted N-formylglutamate amidohydrolase
MAESLSWIEVSIATEIIDITPEEEVKRLHYHHTYFVALRIALGMAKPKRLYAIHSFTPDYEGSIRTVQVGLLTAEDD